MTLLEKARSMLKSHVLCDFCLGRQFSHLATGTTNEFRGKAIKTVLAMECSENFSEENLSILSVLAKSGSTISEKTLRKKEKNNVETEKCYLCEDLLKKLDKIVEKILPTITEYEFQTFLIGTTLPKDYLEREAELKEKFDLQQSEFLKQKFNRNLGKKLSEKMSKDVDFQSPDIVIQVNPINLNIQLKVKSLYIYGRYQKYIRTIPQTRWICRKCKGKGCSECNNTGKRYSESIEELIEVEAVKRAKAEKGVLHGAGREDIDALMLGTGRPFVLELISPRVRNLNLHQIEKDTNRVNRKKIKVDGYRWSSKKELIHLKNSAQETKKEYRALITLSSPVSEDDLRNLETTFQDIIIEQRTPIRVSHRRADKVRKKRVYSVKFKTTRKNNEIEAIIRCDGGCYIKELISGDCGRTTPNFANILGVNAVCKELDVIKIEEKQFNPNNR